MIRRLFTQRILWNAITVEITYEPNWLGSSDIPEEATGHLQIRSLSPDHAALPITQTGYRSHFLPTAEVLGAGGPLAYVRAWLDEEATSKRWQQYQEASRQYALF